MPEPKESKQWAVYDEHGKLIEIAAGLSKELVYVDHGDGEQLVRVLVTPIVKK
jgi:hypothetical protein